MTTRSANAALFVFALMALAALPARASLFSLAASGTISSNSSGDSTIPIGTPWSFQLTYDTAAPDLDFELTGSPDPTFGRFTNTGAPPALTFFHYKAGSYEVTLDDPVDFGTFSVIDITFTSVNAIDVNINAPALFPHLAGGPVSFHADFNAFSTAPIFTSDALPTNTALGPGSFDQSTVTLLPPAGVVSGGSLTSLTLRAGPSLMPDTNGDGFVDISDIQLIASVWLHEGPPGLSGDANLDGVVDISDIQTVAANWLITWPPGGAGSGGQSVPEPSTAALGTIGLLALLVVTMRARRTRGID